MTQNLYSVILEKRFPVILIPQNWRELQTMISLSTKKYRFYKSLVYADDSVETGPLMRLP